jgi:hypothetical protein
MGPVRTIDTHIDSLGLKLGDAARGANSIGNNYLLMSRGRLPQAKWSRLKPRAFFVCGNRPLQNVVKAGEQM